MKKILKRRFSLWIAIALFIMAVIPAQATSSPDADATPILATAGAKADISVETANTKDMLAAYRVVDITYLPTSNSITYEFSAIFKAFQASENGSEYRTLTAEQYSKKSELELKEILGDFSAYIKGIKEQAQADYKATTDDTGKAVFNEVSYGQYIILGSGNSRGAYIYQTVTAEFVPYVEDGKYKIYESYDVTMKTSKPSVDKKIILGTVDDNGIKTSSIGDTVKYEASTTVPTYPEKATNTTFYIKDTLSDGLTLKSDATSIVVAGYNRLGGEAVALTKDTDYTVEIDGQKLYIDFKYDKIKSFVSVTATYEAILNEKAIIGTQDGNPNKLDLIYSNDPFNGNTSNEHPEGDGYGSSEDIETIYTYALLINKFESGAESKKLANATFEIYENFIDGDYNGLVGTIITDEKGYATFIGLEAGDYYIKETIAPSGYKLLSEPIKITINKSQEAFYKATKTDRIEYTSDIAAALIKVQARNDSGQPLYLSNANEPTIISEGNKIAYIKSVTTSVVDTLGKGTSADGYYKLDVANVLGVSLPSTGGIGTKVFVVVGSILTIGAIILLITKKRMENR